MTRPALLAAWFLLVAVVPALAADRVSLTNGDVLTGTIRGGSGTDLLFDADLAGRVTLKWSSVRQLTSDTLVSIELVSGDVLQGTLAVDEGRLLLTTGDSPRVSLTSGDVRSIGRGSLARWRGSVDGDVALSRGNTQSVSTAISAMATRSGSRNQLATYVTHIFSDVGQGAERVTLARTFRAGTRYERELSGPLFGFGFGDVENDPIQLLELRTVFGAGGGVRLVNSGRAQVNLFGGFSLAHDRYTEAVTLTAPATTTTTTTTPAAGASSSNRPATAGAAANAPGQLRRNIVITRTPPAVVNPTLSRDVGEYVAGQESWAQLSDRVSLSQRLVFFPAIGNAGDYRVSFDSTLYAQITDRWQWHVSASDRYLRIPPAGGAVRNDLFISSGLGMTFGSGNGGGYSGADTRRR